jgi:nucleotide-binding universal stress UspA family protein
MLGGIEGSPLCGDFHVMLLCVERLPDRDLYPDDGVWRQECLKHQTTNKTFLEEARADLIAKGLPEAAVETRYLESMRSPLRKKDAPCSLGTSVAQEILRVLKEEDYGTAVIGRRGVSKAEEFLFGSVSTKIIHSAKDCTVWVVA